jgi:hypothetical protein
MSGLVTRVGRHNRTSERGRSIFLGLRETPPRNGNDEHRRRFIGAATLNRPINLGAPLDARPALAVLLGRADDNRPTCATMAAHSAHARAVSHVPTNPRALACRVQRCTKPSAALATVEWPQLLAPYSPVSGRQPCLAFRSTSPARIGEPIIVIAVLPVAVFRITPHHVSAQPTADMPCAHAWSAASDTAPREAAPTRLRLRSRASTRSSKVPSSLRNPSRRLIAENDGTRP